MSTTVIRNTTVENIELLYNDVVRCSINGGNNLYFHITNIIRVYEVLSNSTDNKNYSFILSDGVSIITTPEKGKLLFNRWNDYQQLTWNKYHSL
jgi:hypothetical protein